MGPRVRARRASWRDRGEFDLDGSIGTGAQSDGTRPRRELSFDRVARNLAEGFNNPMQSTFWCRSCADVAVSLHRGAWLHAQPRRRMTALTTVSTSRCARRNAARSASRWLGRRLILVRQTLANLQSPVRGAANRALSPLRSARLRWERIGGSRCRPSGGCWVGSPHENPHTHPPVYTPQYGHSPSIIPSPPGGDHVIRAFLSKVIGMRFQSPIELR